MSSFSSQASHSGLSSRTNSSRPQAQAHPRSDKLIKRPRVDQQQLSHRPKAEHGCRPNCMHTSEPGPCSLQCGPITHKGIRTEFSPQSLSHSRHIYSAHNTAATCQSHTRTGTSDGLGWPFRPTIKFGRCLPHRPDSPASSSSCNEAPGPAASSDFILQPNKFQAPATPINPSSSINANRCSSTHKVIQVPPDSLDSPSSSSPHSISFPTTPVHPHPHRPRTTYSFLKPSPSSSSFDTTSSVSSPLRLPYPLPESPSPSPSPRSRKSGTRRYVGFIALACIQYSRYFGFSIRTFIERTLSTIDPSFFLRIIRFSVRGSSVSLPIETSHHFSHAFADIFHKSCVPTFSPPPF